MSKTIYQFDGRYYLTRKGERLEFDHEITRDEYEALQSAQFVCLYRLKQPPKSKSGGVPSPQEVKGRLPINYFE